MTAEEQMQANNSEILRLQQELSQRPRGRKVGGLKTETKIVTFWKVQRCNNLPYYDDELADRWSELVREMEDDGWRLQHVFGGGSSHQTEKLVFERTSRPRGEFMFSMNTLLSAMRKLAEGTEEWTVCQKIQRRGLPDDFTDWVAQVIKAIDPRSPSAHLISADEMALILMKVAVHFAPDSLLADSWKRSVRESRETGYGQHGCHIRNGVVDQLDDHMTRLLGDPGDE